jgi:hypothetical protein
LFSKVAIALSATLAERNSSLLQAVHIRLAGWHFSISSNQWAPTICVCSSAPFRYFHAVALKKTLSESCCFFSLLPQRDWAFFVP